jgi:MFS family permease
LTATAEPPAAAADDITTRALLRTPGFRAFALSRLLVTLGIQVQSTAVGWQIYEITGSTLDLGLVGLAQFLPLVGLTLVGGHVADRFDRKRVMGLCIGGVLLLALALLGLTAATGQTPRAKVNGIYAVLVLFGALRAFLGPATSALLPGLVPSRALARAVALNSTVWQVATIAGPAVGGLVYGWGQTLGASRPELAGPGVGVGALFAYASTAVLVGAGVVAMLFIPKATRKAGRQPATLKTLFAGIGFIAREPLVLGAISLDLFAVLFGGATALLPAYAKDVLHTGPEGLGLLRAAPAVGAAVIAIWLAGKPIARGVGWKMLVSVAIFGVATIAFGVSRWVWVSVIALLVAGAADMVSVVVRQTLVQLATPDAMRGRVGAVNQVFISASNELGEFESGLSAAWLGAVPAVVIGGVGTCVVVLLWAWLFPPLRRVDAYPDAAV